MSPSKQDRAVGVPSSPSTVSADPGWSKTMADDDTVPVSDRANVAERARAAMAAVRRPASEPMQRSTGLSGGAEPSGGAGLVTAKPAGTSVGASSARRARAAATSPGGLVVVVAAPALPVVVGAAGAVVAVLAGSPAGAGAVSGVAVTGVTTSACAAGWRPRAASAGGWWSAPLPPQVAPRVAAPRHRTPSSRSCSTSRRVTPPAPRSASFALFWSGAGRAGPGRRLTCHTLSVASGVSSRRSVRRIRRRRALVAAMALTGADAPFSDWAEPTGAVSTGAPARPPVGRRPPGLDDPATPLSEVTFVVIDLETTGTVPGQSRIIEVAAAKYRGGECLGTFQTLVNPGCGLPPFIVALTGITEAVVVPAPAIDEVLPSLLEFVAGAVLVGHTLRFDPSFLDADLVARGRPRLSNPRVDTLTLARRLVRDEVPDCRLATLAARFHTVTRPTHRALDDVLATAEVLHALFERAAGFGVLALDDLLALPSSPLALRKLPLMAGLPRAAGVYLFRAADGRVLHVGRAADVRHRVRSLFVTGGRRRVARLLRETVGIEYLPAGHPLEAAVTQARLHHAHRPWFDGRPRRWKACAYVKLTAGRWVRLAVVHTPRADGGVYLGPFAGVGPARFVRSAIEAALPLQRGSADVA